MLKEGLTRIAEKHAQKLHVTVNRLHITVGTEDPRSTAISYGGVAQSVSYLLEFLEHTVSLTPIRKDAVLVQADYLGTWDADVDLEIRIRIGSILRAALTAAFLFLSKSKKFNS